MAKDVPRLLRQRVSGEAVGQMMIEDLVASYQNTLHPEGTQQPLLTDAEKTALVESLVRPEDIRRYSEYRYVHEYLLSAQMYLLLQSRSADAYANKLYPPLEMLAMAEEERKILPGIQTMLQRDYSAEAFVSLHLTGVSEDLAAYRDALATWCAAEAAMGLVGEMIGVPEVTILAPALDLSLLNTINALMAKLPGLIEREDEAHADALREGLRGRLAPIDLEALVPTEQARQAVREELTFASVHGGMPRLYAMLKRESTP